MTWLPTSTFRSMIRPPTRNDRSLCCRGLISPVSSTVGAKLVTSTMAVLTSIAGFSGIADAWHAASAIALTPQTTALRYGKPRTPSFRFPSRPPGRMDLPSVVRPPRLRPREVDPRPSSFSIPSNPDIPFILRRPAVPRSSAARWQVLYDDRFDRSLPSGNWLYARTELGPVHSRGHPDATLCHAGAGAAFP